MMVFTSAATKDRGFDERGIVGSMQQSFEEDCFSIGQGPPQIREAKAIRRLFA